MNVYGGAGNTAGVCGSHTALGAAGMGVELLRLRHLVPEVDFDDMRMFIRGFHLSVVDRLGG
jgi:hypothetical protein